jgi:RHS repeat-associated protein
MATAGGIGGILAVTTSSPSTPDPRHSSLFLYDGNGNVTNLADADSAATLATYEYGPFGNTLVAAGPLAETNPIRFSTKYFEGAQPPGSATQVSGLIPQPSLYYYGYRYYSSGTGRWVSRDPIGERGGASLYAFVRNCPAYMVDPLGRNSISLGVCQAVASQWSTDPRFTNTFVWVEAGAPDEDAQRQAAVRQGKCPVSIQCRPCKDAYGYDGYHEPVASGGGRIVISYDRMQNTAELARNLRHELQHARDRCVQPGWNAGSSCAECLCRELSARYAANRGSDLEDQLLDSYFSCAPACGTDWPSPGIPPTQPLRDQVDRKCGTRAAPGDQWNNEDRCWWKLASGSR